MRARCCVSFITKPAMVLRRFDMSIEAIGESLRRRTKQDVCGVVIRSREPIDLAYADGMVFAN